MGVLGRLVRMACLSVVLTGCSGSSTATSSPTSATPVSVAQPTPGSLAQPTLTGSPASAETVTLVVDPSATTASYHAHEQLVGNTLPSEAVGTSTGVSGSIVL